MTLSPLGRIVEIADNGRHLAKERGFLTVRADGAEIGRVPLDDIAGVVATSAATTISCVLLAALADRGIPFVLCGRNFAPAGLLWPVAGHHAQQRRMEAQLRAGPELNRAIWAEIVAAKIRQQGAVLEVAGKPAGAFIRLSRLVEPGDPENIEAQAARRYWRLLMGGGFRRDPAAEGVNALLNYGYTVLRAATARAIVAAGLHPGLGIFHRHPRDAMPLADDLMEPFRPIIDDAVLRLRPTDTCVLDTDMKRALAGVLQAEQTTAAGRTPLSTCLFRLAGSVAESFQAGRALLDLPIVSRDPRHDGSAP